MRAPTLIMMLLVASGCAVLREPPAPDRPETAAQAAERREKASRPTYNLAGYPPGVREGYIDGCESAKKTQYGRKDPQRFANDAQYKMGWNDGFGICAAKK